MPERSYGPAKPVLRWAHAGAPLQPHVCSSSPLSHHSLPDSQIWRLCFFIAGLPIIWWIGRGSMNIAVWGVERTMFTWQNAVG